MDRSRVNQILDAWSAVASDARRPATAPRPVVVRGGFPSASLAGAGVLAVALVIAVVGGQPSVPSATASAAATPSVGATPSASPTPTAEPTIGPCVPATLSARITLWEGAAGHRIAHVELTNAGSVACMVPVMARPQLVDGRGSVLIDGTNPTAGGIRTVVPGGILKTLVQDGNYCGPAPVAPVTVAFVVSDGGRIVATPFAPSDATLPPCNGAPGSPGDIEMQPLAP
jgi:hypothetical protein